MPVIFQGLRRLKADPLLRVLREIASYSPVDLLSRVQQGTHLRGQPARPMWKNNERPLAIAHSIRVAAATTDSIRQHSMTSEYNRDGIFGLRTLALGAGVLARDRRVHVTNVSPSQQGHAVADSPTDEFDVPIAGTNSLSKETTCLMYTSTEPRETEHKRVLVRRM